MAENKAKNTEKNKSNNHKNNKPKKTYKKTDGVKKDKKSYNHSKKTITKKSTEKKAKKPAKPLHIIPLGGLGEIGKNITVYEYDGDMFLVDCGMSFPDENTKIFAYETAVKILDLVYLSLMKKCRVLILLFPISVL